MPGRIAGEAEEEEAQQGAADDSSAAVYQFRPQVEVSAAYCGAVVQVAHATGLLKLWQ
jgi:hypothetical protein